MHSETTETIMASRKLTKKEEVIMNIFWDKGAMFIRELREQYPDPKPHNNTLSTQVRTLEADGFVDHKSYGPTYQYFARISREEYNKSSLTHLVDRIFGNSYMSMVSSLVEEEKISVDELKSLIDHIENNKQS